MKGLILIVLVTPLVFVVATKDPHAIGQFVQVIVTIGAKLLDAVATLIIDIVNYQW